MNIEAVLHKIERDKNGALLRMTPAQHRRVCSLIRKTCCNCIDGECIALNCKCAQCQSYSVCCKWFRQAVLPQDEALLAELIGRENKKHCTICGKPFIPGSNRAKYCSECSRNERKRKKARNERRYRERKRGHLEY